jgi:hypothetical protein
VKKRQIYYIGTAKMNRVAGNKLLKPRKWKRLLEDIVLPRLKERQIVICVQSNSIKVVSLISSYVGREPITEAKRWNKKEKKHVYKIGLSQH